jgi:hypothetical protein
VDDLDGLKRDLLGAGAAVLPAVRAVTAKGALNVKNEWRQHWTGHAHAPLLPLAVTYDTSFAPTGAEAVIGPDKDKSQGALGNLFEYGSSNNAPIPGGAPALDKEAPRFEQALGDVAERVL